MIVDLTSSTELYKLTEHDSKSFYISAIEIIVEIDGIDSATQFVSIGFVDEVRDVFAVGID
jgi:hypothetical protein